MSAAVFYPMFNNKVVEFFDDLIATFPEMADFRQFKAGFRLLTTMDERQPQRLFAKHVLPKYGDVLSKRDESIFLQEGFAQQVGAPAAEGDQWSDIIGRIQQVWRGTSQANKDAIWSYFQLLIALSQRCSVSS